MTKDEFLAALDSDQTKALNALLLEQRTELQEALAANEQALVAAHAEEVATLQADKVAIQQSLTDANTAHATAIKTLTDEHTAAIDALNEDHAAAVKVLTDQHAAETTAHNEAMRLLQEKMAQAKAEVGKTRELYTNGVTALKDVVKLFQSETVTGRDLQKTIDREKAIAEKAAAEAAAVAAQAKIDSLNKP